MKCSERFLIIFSAFILFFNCSNEKSSWEKAAKSDTTPAYEAFLKSYPDGQYADSAKLKIEGRSVEIYTIPGELNIYFARVDTGKTDVKSLGSEWVKIYDRTKDKHYLIDSTNLKGKSPIVINDVEPGKYLFAIEPVEFYSREMRSQNDDPFMKPIALVSSFELGNYSMMDRFRNGEIKLDGAVIYFVEKKAGQKALVIVYTRDDNSLSELENLYPKEVNFTFDDSKLRSQLTEKNFNLLFSEAATDTTIDLLRRGGRIAARKANIRFLIQIKDKDNFLVETYRRNK